MQKHYENSISANSKLSVYDFTDYRSFLQQSFYNAKKRNSKFTYNAWAHLLGLKNSTSLLKIIKGEREAGSSISERLCQYFKFKAKERQYFEDLIRLSKTQDDVELQMLVLDRLQKNNPYRFSRVLSHQEFSSISSWWYYGIRQIVRLKTSVKNDPQAIAEMFLSKVKVSDVKIAIQTMLDLGFLGYNEKEDVLYLKEYSLNTTDDVASEALKQFHESVIDLGRSSIRTCAVDQREISGVTLAISKSELKKMKEFIRRTQDQFCELFGNHPNPDTVYQFENLFFPLTKKQDQVCNEEGENEDVNSNT